MAELAVKRVVRMDQSPMNAKRWCFTLECGHEVWLTKNRRPDKLPKHLNCERCRAEASQPERMERSK